jgi:uncharacterized protein (DUF1697 family)
MARAKKPGTSDAPTHVALLRGINVGGKHIVPMAALSRMFEEAGGEGVRTYIQSGNVVFSATPSGAKRVARAVGEMIAAEFGFEPRIMVRTREDLERVAAGNPLITPTCDPKRHHVGFLAETPAASRVAGLDPGRSPRDRFVVQGDVIYVHYGVSVADSKLTGAYIDGVLGTSSTFRNWRTVLKLAEMVGAGP